MEETKCLKPSDWRIGWIADKAHRCGMRGQDRAAFSFEDREATRHASVHLAQLCEAVGGELELVVKLPQRPVLRLHQIATRSDS